MEKAIIVGATSGIGKDLARLMAAEGYRVGITGRRKTLLETLRMEKPEAYVTCNFDVTDTVHVVASMEKMVAELGGVDLIVISSGTGYLNETLEFEKEHSTIETNVKGFTCVADWAFHFFEEQGFGHLVAISSVAGLRGLRHSPAYGASKAYQMNYLEGLRQKAVHSGIPISVTDIRPGFVDTDMAKGEGLFWVASTEKAALQIFKALRNKRNTVYVTKRWWLVGWILKRIPPFLYNRI
jgi:short-subunit dehydrogenase